MILCANAALQSNIQQINELNVFPVPDGDTGTNMGLTLSNAVTELNKRDFSSLDATADCVASALLRGARGNSGVILSLLFRGISKRLKGMDSAGAVEFAGAMCDGVDAAYKAVMKPAEGTILTVSRLASAAAKKAADVGADVDSMLECAVVAAEEALADTVNQNPVLKKAGVIDAGGKGYLVILTAMLQSFRGQFELSDTPAVPVQEESVFSGLTEEEITFAFDTVFIVRKQEGTSIAPYRAWLDTIGDSIVIGEDDEAFKVHVHTNIPGEALTEAQKYGTLELAKIENMRTQASDLAAGRKAQTTDDLDAVEKDLEDSSQPEEPEKEFGVVSVCAGEGMADVFRQLGCDRIVTGGQTMNPSTEDILREVNRTNASTVFILPNNKNIIMAAEQCIPLSSKKVIVIPSKTVPQGITAMLNFMPDSTAEEITAAMTDSLASVHTAMVTYAARDSEFDGHTIHAGEYLSLLDGALVGSYTGLSNLFKELSWAIDDLKPEFITMYYGEDVNEQDASSISSILTGNFPDAEITVINGGQPVYFYMISIE
ncbi:MAG: DAK2 domain-containing protein [Oscillospiraceae bacterium]|nr:DAK2 domain-containing protein [Oscillospiraceae bacterium]MBO6093563.1 DAK2 domain-containing protein [Oscillospiraceae bacterium]